MAVIDLATIKTWFETGDKPTQQQFSDMLDSLVHQSQLASLQGLGDYSTSKVYVPGNTVVYNENIYRCAVTTVAGAFETDKWQLITVKEVLNDAYSAEWEDDETNGASRAALYEQFSTIYGLFESISSSFVQDIKFVTASDSLEINKHNAIVGLSSTSQAFALPTIAPENIGKVLIVSLFFNTTGLNVSITGAKKRDNAADTIYLKADNDKAMFVATSNGWYCISRDLGGKADVAYVDGLIDALSSSKEDASNKSNTVGGNETSTMLFPSIKGMYDWATGLFATISDLANKANKVTVNRLNSTSSSQGATKVLVNDEGIVTETNVALASEIIDDSAVIGFPALLSDSLLWLKNYTDGSVYGLKFKVDCVVASISNVNILAAPASIDGVTLGIFDRVLLKDQSDATENGCYVFNGVGNLLTRSDDTSLGVYLVSATFPISSGTVNQDTWFTCINDSITLGSTSIVFSQTGGAGTYTNGAGITLIGNVFSIAAGAITNAMLQGSIDLATKVTGTLPSGNLPNSGVSAGTYNNVTVDNKGRVTAASVVAYLTAIANGYITNAMLAGGIDLTTKVTGLLPNANIASASVWNAKVDRAGDTMSGFLTLNANPTNAMHAATKAYIDNLITGLSWKQSVRCICIQTAGAVGYSSIPDGVTLVNGDRVLLFYTSLPEYSGIYIVNTSGAWARAEDANTSAEIIGATVYVREGTLYKDTQWTCTNDSIITVDTTPINWVQISGAGTYTNGSGLTLTGNVFSIAAAAITNAMLAGSIDDSKILSASTWNAKVSLNGTETLANKTITTPNIASVKGTLTANTDGSTITFNKNTSDFHNVILGGNRTLALSNMAAGDRIVLRLTQDGTGGRTVGWFSTIKWAGGTVPTLTIGANKADVFGFLCTSPGNFDGFIIGQNI